MKTDCFVLFGAQISVCCFQLGKHLFMTARHTLEFLQSTIQQCTATTIDRRQCLKVEWGYTLASVEHEAIMAVQGKIPRCDSGGPPIQAEMVSNSEFGLIIHTLHFAVILLFIYTKLRINIRNLLKQAN